MPRVPRIVKKHKIFGNSPVSNKRIKKHKPDVIVKGSSSSVTAKNDYSGSHFQTIKASTKKKSHNVQQPDPHTENTSSATIKLNLYRNAKLAHKRQSGQNHGNRRKIERSPSLTHNKLKHQKGNTIVLAEKTSVKTKIIKRKDVEREPKIRSKRMNVSRRRANDFEATKGENYRKKRPITSSAINRWATKGNRKYIEGLRPNELKAFELKERLAYKRSGLKLMAEKSSMVPRAHTTLDAILRAYVPENDKIETECKTSTSTPSPGSLSYIESKYRKDYDSQVEEFTQNHSLIRANTQKSSSNLNNSSRWSTTKRVVKTVLPKHYGHAVLASRHSYVSSTLDGECIMYSHPAEYTAPVQYSAMKKLEGSRVSHSVVEPMTPPRQRIHPLQNVCLTTRMQAQIVQIFSRWRQH